jgi:hypothetical protein
LPLLISLIQSEAEIFFYQIDKANLLRMYHLPSTHSWIKKVKNDLNFLSFNKEEEKVKKKNNKKKKLLFNACTCNNSNDKII